MASAMPHHLGLLLVVLLVSPAAAAGACASEKFPAGKTYATCEDLPQLGAALHWTYDEAKSSLSVAFVAAPAAPNGWVAWGLNPTGDGMPGAQALVALKGSSSTPVVKTYNITGYVQLGGASTPIAFPATDLAADSGSGGKIRLYGKLQLRKGMKTVNQVWQVGSSVTGGAPDKHAVAAGNLSSKAKLVLSSKTTAAPSPAPGPVSSHPPSSDGSATATAPSTDKSPPSAATATAAASAATLIALALVGFLAVV